jgi:hypothetical protein
MSLSQTEPTPGLVLAETPYSDVLTAWLAVSR